MIGRQHDVNWAPAGGREVSERPDLATDTEAMRAIMSGCEISLRVSGIVHINCFLSFTLAGRAEMIDRPSVPRLAKITMMMPLSSAIAK